VPVAEQPAALRPPLKWAGGKRWQVPHIAPLWQRHRGRRLVEPFCGGLAMALGLMPSHALLNDNNPHLINFYTWLQRGLVIDWPMRNEESAYYAARDRFNALLSSGHADSREAAGLFYYLNRTGYNGLCRFSKSGVFNVPFGRHRSINYVTDFEAYRPVLAPWRFTAEPITSVAFDADDFVYADPPYDVEFTQYSQGGFAWTDQEQTAAILSEHPGPVVLVNQATDRIVRLYRGLGYDVRFVDAPRRISRTGDRTPAREVIATRNL
jgi:DNA adenine methylase